MDGGERKEGFLMAKNWTFINDDLKAEVTVFAVDLRAAQTCLEILLRYYQRDEWRVKEAS